MSLARMLRLNGTDGPGVRLAEDAKDAAATEADGQDTNRFRLIFPGDVVMVPGRKPFVAEGCSPFPIRAFAIHKPKNACTDMTHAFFSAVVEELRGRLALESNQNSGAQNLAAATTTIKLHPIGQLDKNTTGLFLICTNGDAANYLNLPGTTTKTYVATYIGKRTQSPTLADCGDLDFLMFRKS